jgi:hypothetical protein
MNSKLRAMRSKIRAKIAEEVLAHMFCKHTTSTMYRTHDGYNRWSCNACGRMVLRKEVA